MKDARGKEKRNLEEARSKKERKELSRNLDSLDDIMSSESRTIRAEKPDFALIEAESLTMLLQPTFARVPL